MTELSQKEKDHMALREQTAQSLLYLAKLFRPELMQAGISPEFLIGQIQRRLDLRDPKIDQCIDQIHEIIHKYELALIAIELR